MKVAKRLQSIQENLHAEKGQKNTYAGFSYRNIEDIMAAVKPHLGDAVLVFSEELAEVAGRVYIKSTVTLTEDGQSLTATAFAREQQTKKGMDEAQITGSTTSYARKYAAGGFFLIDNTKDADSSGNNQSSEDEVLRQNAAESRAQFNQQQKPAQHQQQQVAMQDRQEYFQGNDGQTEGAQQQAYADYNKGQKDLTRIKQQFSNSSKHPTAEESAIDKQWCQAIVSGTNFIEQIENVETRARVESMMNRYYRRQQQ